MEKMPQSTYRGRSPSACTRLAGEPIRRYDSPPGGRRDERTRRSRPIRRRSRLRGSRPAPFQASIVGPRWLHDATQSNARIHTERSVPEPRVFADLPTHLSGFCRAAECVGGEGSDRWLDGGCPSTPSPRSAATYQSGAAGYGITSHQQHALIKAKDGSFRGWHALGLRCASVSMYFRRPPHRIHNSAATGATSASSSSVPQGYKQRP
ncbi:hypothetical protein B0T16DRAFT_9815 [Cercophora newfieldiana]|uniref:Uncharacterized protein n=1 Tax=Cercophora newfieldiana TaxID=92897 RepID=A0AA39YMN0_9PEZI|nr:hypothetical protein B0T16DRAFT_9815 [Cercophora newfieldiana]